MEPYLGEIKTFAFGQIPHAWMSCDGQVLSVSKYRALFSLIGTTYGGNGTTTFNLPDLRGAAMLGYDTNDYGLGYAAGTEQVALTVTQTPPHKHNVQVVDVLGTQPLNLSDDYLARIGVFEGSQQTPKYSVNGYIDTIGTPVVLAQGSINIAGGNSAHENRSPFLPMNVCICVTGVFPTED